MSRPKKPVTKSKGIRIRLTEYEHMVIKELSKTLGVSTSSLFLEGFEYIARKKYRLLSEEQKAEFIDRTLKLTERISEKERDKQNQRGGCEAKMKFRKKPVVIDAYQTDKELDIETLEGTMHANVGDWIITGVNGERYPCKPDIFEKTYEQIDDCFLD